MDLLAGNLMSPATLNRYAYAGCSPTNYIDPSGMNYFDCVNQLVEVIFAGSFYYLAGGEAGQIRATLYLYWLWQAAQLGICLGVNQTGPF